MLLFVYGRLLLFCYDLHATTLKFKSTRNKAIPATRAAIVTEATRRASAKVPRTMKADARTFQDAINAATAEVCAELGVDFNALPRDAAPAA